MLNHIWEKDGGASQPLTNLTHKFEETSEFDQDLNETCKNGQARNPSQRMDKLGNQVSLEPFSSK